MEADRIKEKIFFYHLFWQCCYYTVIIFIPSNDVKNTVRDSICLLEIVVGPLNVLAPISTYLALQFQMHHNANPQKYFFVLVFFIIILE